jgi:hypothetical protein
MEPLRIGLWSGPRNVSTAVMYSFAQRRDARVVDEPLYGYYLESSGVIHPGRDEVIAAMDTDGRRVVREVILGDYDRPVVLFKLMAHHLEGLDWAFLERLTNVLLVRDPADVVRSLRHQVPNPDLRDTGMELQSRIHDYLEERGRTTPVVDARGLLNEPRGVLSALCDAVGIEWDEAMLAWEPGARPEDGVWAPHWYHNVHLSSGFQPYSEKSEPVPEELVPLVEECRPYYDRLLEGAIHAPGRKPNV